MFRFVGEWGPRAAVGEILVEIYLYWADRTLETYQRNFRVPPPSKATPARNKGPIKGLLALFLNKAGY